MIACLPEIDFNSDTLDILKIEAFEQRRIKSDPDKFLKVYLTGRVKC